MVNDTDRLSLVLSPTRLVPRGAAPLGALPLHEAEPWPEAPFAVRVSAWTPLPSHAAVVVPATDLDLVRRYAAEARTVVAESARVLDARAARDAGATHVLATGAFVRMGERRVRERPAPARAVAERAAPAPVRGLTLHARPGAPAPPPADGSTRPLEQSVAIVGLSCILPEAETPEAFWELVTSARSAITEVPKDRWDADRHWDPDPAAPDKTYSKIGAFVRGFRFDPVRFRIPPATAARLDPVQQWALVCAASALADAGYAPREHEAKDGLRPFDRTRCAVILGNALGGEMKDRTALRVQWNDVGAQLDRVLAHIPEDERRALLANAEREFKADLPTITEDSMPGELSNVIAGRIANMLDLGGKNVTTDAACASSLAALDVACRTLASGEADLVLAGGADRSMDPIAYVKFSKIGALSPDGSRPFDAGANGFVMGEGCVILVLKRLTDAMRDGDRVYAVIRSLGGSSDGKGKGITAPNPNGQRLAVRRAFEIGELRPRHVQLVEAHGTSTPVGDVVEVQSLAEVWGDEAAPGTVALGSVKSQIGHLKSAAAAAGALKAVLALHHRTLPPSANLRTPNPRIDWPRVPFRVQTRPEPWPAPPNGEPRRAGVSSFGFGGTNFHLLVEEYLPQYHGRLLTADAASAAAPETRPAPAATARRDATPVLVVGGPSPEALADAVAALAARAPASPDAAWCRAESRLDGAERVAVALPPGIDARARLAEVAGLLRDPAKRALLPMKGAFHAAGAEPGKVAFLFPGQGSQYAGMLADMRAAFPVVDATFREADEALQPYLGARLTDLMQDEDKLRETSVTQPAMLAADVALLRLLDEHGVRPDAVAGHSLGEYAALVAAGVLTFPDALVAVSARGKEMENVDVPDLGGMAGVAAPPEVVDEILRTVDGYVVSANKNSPKQTVIAGATAALEKAMEACGARGLDVLPLPVSAAFHSAIVAPATEPLRRVLARLDIRPPRVPVIANVHAEPYPSDREAILDLLSKQVASPVEWQRTMHRLHADGVRVFVEVGPKRALTGFVDANLASSASRDETPSVHAVLTNHPKKGGLVAWTEALAKLAALGIYAPGAARGQAQAQGRSAPPPRASAASAAGLPPELQGAAERFLAEVGRHVAEVGRRGSEADGALAERVRALGLVLDDVVVSGASIGLPGRSRRVFDDGNFDVLFRGETCIDRLDPEAERAFLDKHIVRLVKDGGEPRFEAIDTLKQVIHLAGRRGAFDLADEFGLPDDFVEGLDITAELAVGAAVDALRDAGIPLVREERVTAGGHRLPGQWALPQGMRDDTGIVLASAFPGLDNLVGELARYFADRYGGAAWRDLEAAYHSALDEVKDPAARSRLTAWFAKHAESLRGSVDDRYAFNRKFLFEILSLGHAEVAELLRARGPNTQVNAACASTAQAVAVAEDWIRTGRARRVLVLGADDVTSENLLPWIGSGFLAAGAATTAETVADGALPFDRRRHGMILGMGAVGLVVERAGDVSERGMAPVARLVASRVANSAFHGSRLAAEHIAAEFDRLVADVCLRTGLDRRTLAERSLFVSHETYTPARGGSAGAEVAALRRAFGDAAERVLVTNVKGFTGHPMGAGLEDAVAVKALQHGRVPPVANLKEPDPDLGNLHLSTGGTHDRRFAFRFAAGFGSQLAALCFEAAAKGDARVVDAARHDAWLASLGGGRLEVERRTLRLVGGGAARTLTPVAPARPVPAALPAPAAGAAPAAAVAPAPAPAVTAVADADVLRRLVALVAEKTGYPADALDPTLDLEADLGIDTVKQAELFGQVREQYALPRDDGFLIKDHNTLAKIAAYVVRKNAGTAPAPAAPPAPASAPVPSPDPAPAASDDVLVRLTALVAEKTGYPAEALDPTLDLEADLGIDTVKQAELFGQVREQYALPRDDGFLIKDHNTLAKIAAYVVRKTAVTAPAPAAPPALASAKSPAPAPAPAPAASGDVLARLTALVAEKTGYPSEALDPTLDLEADLGIDTVKQAELFGQVREQYALPRDDGFLIKDHNTLQKIADYVARRTTPAPAPAPASAPASAPAPAPVVRIRARAATLRSVGRPTGAPLALAGRRVLVSEGPLRAVVAEALLPTGAVVVSAAPAEAVVWQGDARALFDLARTHGPFHLVAVTHMGGGHAVDRMAADAAAGALTGLAKSLAHEWPDRRVVALDLDAADAAEGRAAAVAEELVSGDAVEVGRRGAERRVVLLGDVAEGPPASFAAETVVVATGGAQGIAAACLLGLARETRLKAVLLGRTPLPAEAAEWAALEEADWALLRNETLAVLRAKGEKATPVAVEKVLAPKRKAAEIRRTLDALAAAGAEAEYVVGDAADPEALRRAVEAARSRWGRVDLVVHAAGVEESRRLAEKDAEAWTRTFAPKVDGARHLLALSDARTLVLFGSVAGRFGNQAQADYSAANDALTKLAAAERANGRDVRVFAWGPWGETGMATRGSTLTVLQAAGVEPVPTAAGVAAFLDTLRRPGRPETVLAGSLGLLEAKARAGTTFDPAVDAWLRDHEVDGTPYLPGVVGVALFERAADADALAEVRFEYPVKFLRGKARTVSVEREEEALRLVGEPGPLGQPPRTHFSARVVSPSPAPAPSPAPSVEGAVDSAAIYARFFHGPTFRVLRAARVGALGVVAEGADPAPSEAPNLDLEAGLQAAGLHALATAGTMALPHGVGRLDRWVRATPGALRLHATFRGEDAGVWTYDVEAVGADGALAYRMEGLTLIAIGQGPALASDPVPVTWRTVAGRDVAVVPVGPDVDEVLPLLHPAEAAHARAFAHKKRRLEWVAATLAAKAALRRAEGPLAWRAVRILNHEDGHRVVEGARNAVTVGHAAGVAVAVAYDATVERAGVDVEVVEERAASWREEAFAAEERAVLDGPEAETRAWAAKEAFLKALGRGLAEDLHAVRVDVARPPAVAYDVHGRVKERLASLPGSRTRAETLVEDGRVLAVCLLGP